MGVRYDRTAVAWGPTGLVGRWAGVHESPLIGETAVISRGGTMSRGGGEGGGGSRVILMATKCDEIVYSGPYRSKWPE